MMSPEHTVGNLALNIENAIIHFAAPQMPPANDDPPPPLERVFVLMNAHSNSPIGVFTSEEKLVASLAGLTLSDPGVRIRIFEGVSVNSRTGGARDVTRQFVGNQAHQ